LSSQALAHTSFELPQMPFLHGAGTSSTPDPLLQMHRPTMHAVVGVHVLPGCPGGGGAFGPPASRFRHVVPLATVELKNSQIGLHATSAE
jgi:hypothetical protein